MLCVIFGLSSIPNNFQESDSPVPVDKLAHSVEFAALAFVAVGVGVRKVGMNAALAMAASVVFSTAYGITDELHQKFVPGRDVSLSDLAADVAGSIAGAALAAWLVIDDKGPSETPRN